MSKINYWIASIGTSLYFLSRYPSFDNFDKLVDVVSFDTVPTLTDHCRLAPPDPQPGGLLDYLVDFLQRLHELLVVVTPDLVLRDKVPVDIVQLRRPLPVECYS